MSENRLTVWCAALMTMLAVFPQIASSQQTGDLTAVSLESLMKMQVSSVSRHMEELRNTAAAVHVITQEDIRRSGATDIADVLRMVPGIDVAQINSNTWAVSARGFAAQFATKLMVLVDGRSVYDPTFSGVNWHLQNLVLEDIERIEVIRGPGATMWGANAVNGVISITTKRPADTQGGLLVADAGSNRPGEGSFRYGGAIGKTAFYRLYGRQTTRGNTPASSGAEGGDSWNLTDAGVRVDWTPTAANSFVFDAASYRGVAGSRQQALTSLSPVTYGTFGLKGYTGGHFQARWNRSLGGDSNLAVQFYFDRRHQGGYGAKDLTIVDFDLQHNFKIGARNDVMWGMGRRQTSDRFPNTLVSSLTPGSKNFNLWSAFVQDEVSVIPQKLHLTLGSKFERDTFTGYNFQPTARISWTPSVRQSAWVAVSRAVRTANRVERGMQLKLSAFPLGPATGVVALFGRKGTRSEGLLAYEAGYRYQANRKLWLDVSAFENAYDHVSSTEPGQPFFAPASSTPVMYQPLYFGNEMKGSTRGVELAANYRVHPVLSFKGSYSWFHSHLRSDNPAAVSTDGSAGQTPANQFYVGSFLTLPRSFEISGHTYFVASRPSYTVPRYTRVDLRLGWKATESLELSIVGQNLLGTHKEFGDVASPANLVNRSAFGKVAWKF